MNGDSKGYVYSDWGAVAMLKDFQHTAKDDSEAAIQALTAGWTWKLPVIAIGLWSN